MSVISDKAIIAAKSRIADIQGKIASGDYAQAETESKELAALALRGIGFYDTFDQIRLKWIVTSGYVSFALYTLIYTIETYGTTASSTMHRASPSLTLDAVIATLSAVVTGLFVLEKTPWYCLYASFPVFFIRSLLQHQLGRSQAGGWKGKTARQVAILMSGVVATLGVLFAIAVSSSSPLMLSSLTVYDADRLQ